MRKIFVLLACLFLVFVANAQVRFGLKAGYHIAGVKMKTDLFYLTPLNYTKIPGFHAGIIADVALGVHFSLQPGLNYVRYGFDAAGTVPGPVDAPVDVSVNTRYHYLELPLNFLYKHPVGPGKLFAGAGPFLSYGVSGRISGTYDGQPSPKEIVVFLDKKRDFNGSKPPAPYLRPFNAGAGFTLGYEFNVGVLVSGNYNLGLTDVNPEFNISQKTNGWGIGIGYLFNNR